MTPVYSLLAWWHTKQSELDAERGSMNTIEIMAWSAVTVVVVVAAGAALSVLSNDVLLKIRNALGL